MGSTERAFRADIQGLRALAVGLVVVFHLWPGALPGGYVGVDVFFVISGFLITGHLVGELERTGTVSLTRFWARRIRRLLPAAFLVLAASAVLAFAVLPRTLLPQNLGEIGAAAAYVLNWRLAADAVDYLAAENSASLVQHYWSLSVEEQFYLVWPLLVLAAAWLAARSARTSRTRAVTLLMTAVAVASLATSVAMTAASPALAYFVTPTRAWEFAVGGLVALLPPAAARAGTPTVRRLAAWAAVGAIAGSAVLFDAATPFPGWAAAVPVAGAALLLALGDDDHPWAPQAAARLGPVQYVGDTSYAIYLWHWPLIVAAPFVLGHGVGPLSGAALLGLTIALAAATKALVEDPVRRASGLLRRRTPAYAFMAAGIAVFVAVAPAQAAVQQTQTAALSARIDALVDDADSCFGAAAVIRDCADPYAVTDTVDPVVAAGDQWDYAAAPAGYDCTEEQYLATPPRVGIRCRIEAPGPRIALVGDSHAFHLWDAFVESARREGWDVTMYVQSSCSGFENAATSARTRSVDAKRVMSTCPDWAAGVWAELERTRPDLVLFSSRAAGRNIRVADVLGVLGPLQDRLPRLAVVDDTPGMPPGTRGPACVEASGARVDPCASDKPDRSDPVNAAARALRLPIITFDEILCRGGERCHAVIGGTVVYADRLHLTRTFARTLAPYLAARVDGILADPGRDAQP
ncbi:acyltransferase family protein [Microbacterium sp. PA5]|uniref:acyltransferase family protein n=1 Tax=Microbacterium sp. PA5 TaxID=3416654 RepID=UPI003CEFFB7A